MTRPSDSTQATYQPQLADLLARFLQRQTEAHAAGLGLPESGEVALFEAAPAQTADPQQAWDEATAAVKQFQPTLKKAPPPVDWASLVVGHESTTALAFAAGNYPQMVRSLHALIAGKNLGGLLPGARSGSGSPALVSWAEQVIRAGKFPETLFALGVLRAGGHFDLATKLLRECENDVPQEWQAAWANEAAALAWHQGQAEDAFKLWQQQSESVPVLFNRGMASLFLGRAADARTNLAKAVGQLPESSSWHHLGRLYLALAEMRK